MKRDIAGHYIRQNHDTELPRHVLVLDTETTPKVTPEGSEHRFKIGWTARCIISSRGVPLEEEWRLWKDGGDLLDYLEKTAPRGGTLWVFANNVFFDLQALGFFRAFTAKGWKLDFVYDSQTTYMLVIRKGRLLIKALSVSNYWSASTRELGRLLGLEKINVDFDTVSPEDLLIYCFRDTEIALDAMVRYFEIVRTSDLGSFRLSRAAQSYGAWRHRFMSTRVYCHRDEEVRELEENAYMGGRTEAYQIGTLPGGPFACYDINSMYPFIMSRYKLPCKCVDYHSDISLSDAVGLLAQYSMIAEVELDTPEPLYAWKYRGKVIFPVGRFTAYLCTEGLRQALIRGHAVKIKRAAFYQDAVLFGKYIEEFYSLRQRAKASGDLVTDRLAKLLMNSLYGKLAQRRPVIVSERFIEADDYYRFEAFDMVTHSLMVTTRLFHKETVTAGDEIVPGAVVSIPAHITEYGRLLLYDIQERIGRDRVLYCDTDSVFIADPGLGKLGYPVHPSALGALSKKWSTSTLTVWGAKDYETDASAVMKGIPESAELICPRTWRYTFWPGQKTHLGERVDDCYMQRDVVKHADRPYDKGRLNDDGSITPWVLPDLLSSPEIGLLSF